MLRPPGVRFGSVRASLRVSFFFASWLALRRRVPPRGVPRAGPVLLFWWASPCALGLPGRVSGPPVLVVVAGPAAPLVGLWGVQHPPNKTGGVGCSPCVSGRAARGRSVAVGPAPVRPSRGSPGLPFPRPQGSSAPPGAPPSGPRPSLPRFARRAPRAPRAAPGSADPFFPYFFLWINRSAIHKISRMISATSFT